MTTATTLVLGIGNSLLTDEGVGIKVIDHLRLHAGVSDDLELMDGGTLSFTLAGTIALHPRLIVVDAARIDGPAGSIALFEGEAMDERLRGGLQSVHEVGLSDLMDIARLTDSLPSRRALVGIRPQSMDWGESLTPAVAAAVAPAADAVLALLERWDRDPADNPDDNERLD